VKNPSKTAYVTNVARLSKRSLAPTTLGDRGRGLSMDSLVDATDSARAGILMV